MAKINKGIIIDRVLVASGKLKSKVEEIVRDASVSKLVIMDTTGAVNLDISVKKAMVAGGVAMLTAPVLTMIGAIAVLATDHTIEIHKKPESKQ